MKQNGIIPYIYMCVYVLCTNVGKNTCFIPSWPFSLGVEKKKEVDDDDDDKVVEEEEEVE